MTTELAQDVEAGRELDALIAERVMGWTRHPEKMHPTDNRTIGGVLYCPPGHPCDAGGVNVVPCHSTSIAAAWEVVEKMAGDKRRGIAYLSLHGYEGRGFYCGLVGGDGEGDTAPLAICRAALNAVASRTTHAPESA